MAESLLKKEMERFPNRPLPIALAHEFMRAKPADQERQFMLSRIFRRLKPVDQMRCRDELHFCRDIKRKLPAGDLARIQQWGRP